MRKLKRGRNVASPIASAEWRPFDPCLPPSAPWEAHEPAIPSLGCLFLPTSLSKSPGGHKQEKCSYSIRVVSLPGSIVHSRGTDLQGYSLFPNTTTGSKLENARARAAGLGRLYEGIAFFSAKGRLCPFRCERLYKTHDKTNHVEDYIKLLIRVALHTPHWSVTYGG